MLVYTNRNNSKHNLQHTRTSNDFTTMVNLFTPFIVHFFVIVTLIFFKQIPVFEEVMTCKHYAVNYLHFESKYSLVSEIKSVHIPV